MAGFLFSERVIRDAVEIGAVERCHHPDHADAHNVVDVFLRGNAVERARERLARRRRVMANSSCSICGRTSIAFRSRSSHAGAAGITLLDFVRPPGFNVYTHEHRIANLQAWLLLSSAAERRHP